MTEKNISTKLEDYPRLIVEKLRYADTDRQGHVNNAVFANLCECGRVDFLYDRERPLAPQGCEFVIAKLTLNFIKELNWPGNATVGTGVVKVGRSSIHVVQCIFGGDVCVATSESVMVLMDSKTRKSSPLPESARSILEQLIISVRAS